jgi:autotransporter-associated beta strand protein
MINRLFIGQNVILMPSTCHLSLALAAGLAFSMCDRVEAATQYATGSPAFTWGTDAKWASSSGGTYNQAWTSGNDAVFEGTAGTITLNSVSAQNINFNVTGYTLQSSILTLGGTTPTITMGSGISATISSVIAGTVGLTKSGAGSLTLSGANTYSGDTTISAGTNRLGAADVIPDGSGKGNVVMNAAAHTTAVLDLASRSETINGLSGTGAGTNIVDNSTGAGTYTLTVGNNDQSSTFKGRIRNTSGTIALTKTGSGTLTLTDTNTYTGVTTINGGTLKVDTGVGGSLLNAGSFSALTFGGSGATFDYDNTTSTGISTQRMGALTASAGEGTVKITRTALQTVTLTFASVAGRTAGATLNFVRSGTPGVNGTDSSINLTGASAGLLDPGYFFNGSDWAYVNSAGGYVRAPAYGTDSGYAIVNTLQGNSGTHNLLTNSCTLNDGSFFRSTKINSASVINITNNGSLWYWSGINKGGLLRTGGGSTTISGSGQIALLVEGQIRANTASDSVTVNIPMNDSGGSRALTKSGAGLLTLNATNGYSGITSVNGGTLLVNGSVGTAATTVRNGATLGGSGIISGAVTVVAGGTLQPSLSGNVATTKMASATSPNFAAYGTLKVRVPTSTTADRIFLSHATPVFTNSNLDLVIDTTGLSGSASGLTIVQTAKGSGGIAGTFRSVTLTGNTAYTPTINYNTGAGTVTIDLVPISGATKLAIVAVNGGTNATAGLGFNVVVQAQDNGSTAQVANANTAFSLSLATGNGTLGGTLTGTILAGASSTTVSGVTYTKAESGVSVAATRTSGDNLATGTSTTFAVNAGAAAIISMTSENNQTGYVSSALSSPFIVTVTDANTNPVAGTTVSFAITATPGGGSMSHSTSNTAANGQASSTLTLGATPGSYTVTASAAGLSGSPVSFNAVGEVRVPTKLAITQVNGGVSPAAGVAFPVVIQAQDNDGTPQNVTVTTNITLSLYDGNGVLSGTLTGTIPAGSSSNTISGVLYNKAESGVRLLATNTGGTLAPGTSTAFTVTSGPAAILSIVSGNTQTAIINQALSNPMVVSVTDAHTNPVSGASVTFTTNTWPSGATGQAVNPTNTTTAVNGQASSTFTIGSATGTYSVVVTSGALTPVTFTAVARPVPPSKLVITSVNGGTNVTAGQAFSVVIRSLDSNDVPSAVWSNTTLSLSRASGSGTLGGTLSGSLTPGNHELTISGLTYTKAEADVAIAVTRLSGDLLSTGTSAVFTVVAGPAASLTLVSGNSQTASAGSPLPNPLVVAVRDANANPVSGYTVVYAVKTWPVGAVGQDVSPTNAVTDASGNATAIMTLGDLPGSYTIRATATGLSGSPITFSATAVGGTDGTWTNKISGLNWSTAGNWTNNAIASGFGASANFNTLNITADTSVQLDSPRAVGFLVFGDTDTGSAAGWNIGNSGTNANTLTLTANSKPSITVNALGTAKSVELVPALTGTDGFRKLGAGALVLNNASTYSGDTALEAGSLKIMSSVGRSIGFNCVYLNHGNDVTGSDGVVAQANWNNRLTGEPTTNLLDSAGQAAGASVAISTSGSFLNFPSANSSDRPLLRSYWYTLFGASLTARVSNVPYHKYDLYVYVSGYNAYPNKMTVAGTTYYYSAFSATNFTRITNTTPGSNPTGQYVLVENLMGDQTIVLSWDGSGGHVTKDVSIAAIQIVDKGVASLPTNTALSVSSGALLDLNGNRQAVSALSDGTGAGTVTNSSDNPAAIQIHASGSSTFGGVIQDNGGAGPISLTKSGTGTQTLSAAQGYVGTTRVEQGTLNISSSIGTGAVTVATNATLGGAGTIRGPVTVLGGALQPSFSGASGGTLTLTNAASPSFSSGSMLRIRIPTNNAADKLYLRHPDQVFTGTNVRLEIDTTGLIGDLTNVTIVQVGKASGGIVGAFSSTNANNGYGVTVNYLTTNITVTLTAPVGFFGIPSINGGSNPTAGVPFSIVVQAQNNAGVPGNVTSNTSFAISLTNGGGVLSGTLTGTILAGTSSTTVSGITYTKAESGIKLAATRTDGLNLVAGSSAGFTVGAGAATAMEMTSGNGQVATVSTALANPFVVTVTDVYTNPVPGIAVSFAITVTPDGGAMSHSTSNTAANGQASSKLTVGPTPGSYTVTASAAGLIGSPVSFSATGTAAVASKLAIPSINGGTNVTAGTAFNVVVQSQNAASGPQNVAADTAFTISLTTGNGLLAGSLSGTILAGTSSTTVSGVTYTKAESGIVLTATRTSGDTLTAGSSAGFTTVAGAAAVLRLYSGDAQNGPVSSALLLPLVALVGDAYTNPVSGVSVAFAMDTVPGGATGQFVSPSSTNSVANGQAAASMTLGNMSGSYTVSATASGLNGSPLTFSMTAEPPGPVFKAASGTDLTISSSWSSGTVPESTNIATWVPGSLGSGLILDEAASWQGIRISGAASDIAITGDGSLTLGTDGINMSNSSVNMSIALPITMTTSSMWSVKSAKTLTAQKALSGSDVRLTKSGDGTLILLGTNTYDGGTVVSNGTLQIGNGAIGFDGTIAGSVSNRGVLAFNQHGDRIFGGSISGTGSISKAGAGKLTLTALNDGFGGRATVNGGRLNLQVSGIGETDAGPLGNAPITVGSGAALELPDQYVAGTNRAITSAGTIVVSSGNSSDGLQYLNNLVLQSSGSVTGNPFRLGGYSAANITVSGSGTSTIHNAVLLRGGGVYTSTWNVADTSGNDDTDIRVLGSVSDQSGSMALVKSGAGTMALFGSNSISGTSTINAGSLRVDGVLDHSVVTASSGATIGGTGRINQAIMQGGRFSPAIGGVGAFTITNSVTMTGGAYRWSITNATGSAGGSWDLVTVRDGAGTLDLSGAGVGSITIELACASATLPNFDDQNQGSWMIVDAGTVTGFASNKFTVSLANFSAAYYEGTFAVREDGGNLYVTFEPAEPIDLYVASVADSHDPVDVGTPYSYSITVGNDGPETAGTYFITNTLGAGVTYVSSSDGGIHSNGVVRWILSNLASGATRTVTINVIAPLQQDNVFNTVIVTPFRREVHSADNAQTISTTAQCPGAPNPFLVSPGNRTGTNGALLAFSVISTNADCSTPYLQATGLPSGATFTVTTNEAQRKVTGSFNWAFPTTGTYPVRFASWNLGSTTQSIVILIYVNNGSESNNGQGVPQSQTNWHVVITNLMVPSSGNATVVWQSVAGVTYDLYTSTQPIGGGASWGSPVVSGQEAHGVLSTALVASSGSMIFYQVVPQGVTRTDRGVWGIVRPSIPPSVSYLSAPLMGTSDFDGEFGDALAEVLTESGTKIYIMEPGTGGPDENGDPIDWIILERGLGGWTRFGGGSLPVLDPGQGFIIFNTGGSASPTFSGPVGNTGASSISLAGGSIANPGYNIIGISEGKAISASTAFDGIAVVGSYDENKADQVVIMDPYRRLIRRPDGTWYDTGNPNSQSETTLKLQPGQAYYYIRRGSSANLEF